MIVADSGEELTARHSANWFQTEETQSFRALGNKVIVFNNTA
jgi:hypothetical protein